MWVVGVLAGAHPIVRFSADLLSDIPSAAVLLVAVSLLVRELTRAEGPGRRIVFVAPLFALAFYLRYGSLATLLAIGTVTLALHSRVIRNNLALIVSTVALFLLLLVPHFLQSVSATGSLLGILRVSAEVPGHAREGIANYLAGNPLAMYGVLVTPLIFVGMLGSGHDRTSRTLVAMALAQIVVLGLTTHAQSRFIFVAIVLMVIVGVDTARRWLLRTNRRTATMLSYVLLFAVVSSWAGGLYEGCVSGRVRHNKTKAMLLAADAIRRDSNGLPCEVVGRHTAQLDWYSGCTASHTVFVESLLIEVPVYVVRESSDAPAQPSFESIPASLCPILYVPAVVEVARVQPRSTRCRNTVRDP